MSVHDDMRRLPNGRGTYALVRRTARRVLERHPLVGVSAVLTARHPRFDEVFLHLYENIGFRCIYMKPVNTTRETDYGLSPKTVDTFKSGYDALVSPVLAQPPVGCSCATWARGAWDERWNAARETTEPWSG